MLTFTVRLAKPADSPEILEIYKPHVIEGVTSFEYTLPPLAEFSERIKHVLSFYPWLVCEHENRIAGYAYASRQRERSAYQWNAECSVYVSPDFHQKGIATLLYKKLFQILKLQGIVNVYAGITLPNPKSENFHRNAGFEPIGTYSSVGYKHGKWHDVIWMQLALSKHGIPHDVPLSIAEIDLTDIL